VEVSTSNEQRNNKRAIGYEKIDYYFSGVADSLCAGYREAAEGYRGYYYSSDSG
jgi:hypothetical protein